MVRAGGSAVLRRAHPSGIERKWTCILDSLASKQTILIVDDEEMVLTLGRIVLERRGYQVHVALSGSDAIALCRDLAMPLDCVIIDYTMPVMNGRDTLVEIRKILPSIPAIISSGHSDEEISVEMSGLNVSGMIHKPYRQESLVAVLEEVLASI